MTMYYVDGMEEGALKFLAGPFRDEATARKYEAGVAFLARWLGYLSESGDFGVTAISGGYCEPGILNPKLDFEDGDLVPIERSS